MKQLSIIPNPNKIDYLGGSVNTESFDSESFSARLSNKLSEESYVLEVTENGVEATAGGERGAFYASQTLKQLKQLDICPCVRIEDAPSFEYRAFMLDCARHMTTVENIKKLIDAAALVKMNTMHWHLTDDQQPRACFRRLAPPPLGFRAVPLRRGIFGTFHQGRNTRDSRLRGRQLY